jgi:hypothetical protein
VRDLYATYAGAGTVAVYNMSGAITPQFENFKLIGKGSGTSYGIQMRLCKGARIDNVDVSGCDEAQVALIQDYNTSITRVTAHNWMSSAGAYGIVTANCQVLRVSDCSLVAYGQGIANGGGDYVGCVPTREVIIEGSTCTSMTVPGHGVGAVDFHGNCEHYSVKDCDLIGGINASGDLGAIQSCRIMGDSEFGIYLSELLGINFKISGNQFTSTRPWSSATSRGYFVDVSSYTNNLTASTTRGGTLTIENNDAIYTPNAAETGSDHGFVSINNHGCTASLSLIIKGNRFTTPYNSAHETKGVFTDISSGSAFDFVEYSNNVMRGFGVDIRGALEVVASGNTSLDASYHGIQVVGPVSGTTRSVSLRNNLVRGSKYNGIRVQGDTSNHYALLVLSNNVAVENNLVAGLGDEAGLNALNVVEAASSHNWAGGTGAAAVMPVSFNTIRTLLDTDSNYYGTGVPTYSAASPIENVSYEDDYVMHDDAIVTY